MGTRADYVTALTQAFVDAGEDVVGVYDRPISPVPGVPCVMLIPGEPYLESIGRAGYTLRMDAALWIGRLDSGSAMSVMDRLIPIIRATAPEVDLRYLQTSVGVENAAGVDYITARSALEGETQDP